ncbi:MAG TPA: 2-oxoacid:acceptor oxidoreductase family protein [Burkholderiaceae bacterium]|nr:2-oxoacid:acceptor oxidoreductase family protein [Burkholderiaceae bacterium]
MYRIRFHGRGGQGIKTAAQVLGTAFFRDGFEVQDAPRYGAERRGAPIFAYVRGAHETIHERGVITRPDLVVVADDTLIAVPAAGVLQGLSARTVLLIRTAEPASAWQERLALSGPVLTLPVLDDAAANNELPYAGTACAGAAARLVGVITRASLEQAIVDEVGKFGTAWTQKNVTQGLAAFDGMAEYAGLAREGAAIAVDMSESPAWVELPLERASVAAPDIAAASTSMLANTGAWRTLRPVIDYEHCKRCSWICGTLCPESAILADPDRTPRIDYDHCKGCLICMTVCPPHAIRAEAEHVSERST